jgi:hypothetical protein
MNYFFSLLVIIVFSVSASSQDLIERTQQGLPNKKEKVFSENAINKEVVKRVSQGIIDVDIFSFCSSKLADAYRDDIFKAIELDYIQKDDKVLKAKNDGLIRIKIPVSSSKEFSVLLYPVNIFHESFKVYTELGVYQMGQSQSSIQTFRGVVQDHENSIVSASYSGDKWNFLISDLEGNYNIGTLSNKNSTYILYNDRSLIAPNQFVCSADNIPQNEIKINPSQVQYSTKSAASKCVALYFECDYDMYMRHNMNINEVENYMINLISNVSTLYAQYFVNVQLQTLKIWTTPDPYISGEDTREMLDLFAFNLKNNFEGQIAQLVSTRALGGGIAYVDRVCDNYNASNNSGPYAVSAALNTSFASYPTYSWDVQVVAHEMGHTLGSPHTHSCSWPNGPIDNCFSPEGGCAPGPNPSVGTIMSYCHLCRDANSCSTSCPGCPNPGISFFAGFGTQPANLIRNRINNSVCNLVCSCSKFINLAEIVADGSFNAREHISVNAVGGSHIYSSSLLNAPEVEIKQALTVHPNAVLEIRTTGCN